MADKYLIPFGVDGSEAFKTFSDLEKSADNLGNNVEGTVNQMNKSFADASNSGEKLNKVIQVNDKSVKDLTNSAKDLGAQVGNALSGKNVGGGLQEKINQTKKTLEGLKGSAIKFDVDIDEKKIVDLENQIKAASSATEEFNTIISFAKSQLESMKPGKGFNLDAYTDLSKKVKDAETMVKSLGAAEAAIGPEGKKGGDGLKKFGDETKNTETKSQSLRAKLRLMREDLAALELAGKGNTAEFKNLSAEAGELQDQIGDISQRVKNLSSDTKGLDAGIQAIQGIAGAFAAAQGAVALFGDENEEATRVIQKVTGALAILQGIQAAANALNKDSALIVVLTNALRTKQVAVTVAETVAEEANAVATAENTAAQVANTVAEGANTAAEVANATATVAGTAAIAVETAATVTATAATEGFTAALLANPIGLIIAAIVAATAAIYLFASATSEAQRASAELNSTLEFEAKVLDLNLAMIERNTEKRVALAKFQGKAESELTAVTIGGLRQEVNERNITQKALERQQDLLNDRRKRGVGDAKENAEAAKKLDEEITRNKESILDVQTKIEVEGLNRQTQQNKEAEDKRKKSLEDQKKSAEEQRKIADQLYKFNRELESAKLALMDDGLEKQKAEIKLRAKQQTDALNSEVALSKKAADIRNKAIADINKKRDKDLEKAENEAGKKKIALQLEANSISADLQKEGIQKELSVLEAGYESKKADITEKFKDEAALRDKLLNDLYNNYTATQTKVLKEAAKKGLDQEEEAAILGIELMTKYATESTRVEEFKQIEILRIQLEYAQKRLAGLTDDGTQESQTAILKAKKVVSDITKALNTAVKEQGEKGLDLFDVFGLGDLTDKDKEKIKDGLSKSFEAIGQITDFVVGQYQRQIDKKQELIDQYDNEISDLEDRLDTEKELRENGFANNVSILEEELAAKKAAKDEEVRQQEEIQKKQQALQKVQLVADTAIQASNLITASTSIFKSFATIPFGLGIPLAIATVALMSGAFIASKIKAFQMINDQKLGEGGEVDGPSHSEGGVKYRAVNGSGRVVELEGKEYVIRKSKAQDKKLRPMMEYLNTGMTSHLSEDYLRAFLEGTGVTFANDAPANAVIHINENEEAKTIVIQQSSREIEAIHKNVSYLAKARKETVERWDDEEYYYTKIGNEITKRKKP